MKVSLQACIVSRSEVNRRSPAKSCPVACVPCNLRIQEENEDSPRRADPETLVHEVCVKLPRVASIADQLPPRTRLARWVVAKQRALAQASRGCRFGIPPSCLLSAWSPALSWNSSGPRCSPPAKHSCLPMKIAAQRCTCGSRKLGRFIRLEVAYHRSLQLRACRYH